MNEQDLIKTIRDSYSDTVKISKIENSQGFIGTTRTALESAVKLFWLKQYGKIPVWIKNGKEEFNLNSAITDSKFSQFFNRLHLSDMHAIRQICNATLHEGEKIPPELTNELIDRLKKSVNAIATVLKVEILKTTQSTDKTSNGDKSDPMEILTKRLLNQSVKHWIYGRGRIVSIEREKNNIKVDFGSSRKDFRFPDVFKKNFLKLEDPTLQELLIKILVIQDPHPIGVTPKKPDDDKLGTITKGESNRPQTSARHTDDKLGKAESIRLCREHGIEVTGKEITFSSRNRTSPFYWANPNVSLLNLDWILILNDIIQNQLYIFEIPANSISPHAVTARNDKPQLIDLQIYYGDTAFTDSRSGISFEKWLTKTIPY